MQDFWRVYLKLVVIFLLVRHQRILTGVSASILGEVEEMEEEKLGNGSPAPELFKFGHAAIASDSPYCAEIAK